MSVTKQGYITMKRKGTLDWTLFFEYWEDKEGKDLPFTDFAAIMSNIWPQMGQNGQILIQRMIYYFDAKFHITKIISKEGLLLQEY